MVKSEGDRQVLITKDEQSKVEETRGQGGERMFVREKKKKERER